VRYHFKKAKTLRQACTSRLVCFSPEDSSLVENRRDSRASNECAKKNIKTFTLLFLCVPVSSFSWERWPWFLLSDWRKLSKAQLSGWFALMGLPAARRYTSLLCTRALFWS